MTIEARFMELRFDRGVIWWKEEMKKHSAAYISSNSHFTAFLPLPLSKNEFFLT